MPGDTQATSSPSGRIVTESLRGPRLHEFAPPAREHLETVRDLLGERDPLGPIAS